MKKIFALIALLGMATFGLQAQTQIKPGIGINSTNVSGKGAEAKGQIGWQIGASAAFGEKFYFEPGVFYQTNSFEFTGPNGTLASDATYSGVRVPLNLGLLILGNADSAFGLRVFGGGSGYFVTGTNSDFLDKDDVESPQWGVHAGAGLDIAIFYLDASYQWSLSNIQTDINQIDLGKTKGFFLTAGIRF